MKSAFGLALLLWAAGAHAQDIVEPYQEYGKQVKATESVSPLGDELFGEQVSLYNGSTEFSVVDIDIPGNNALPVTLRRKFSVSSGLIGGNFGGFANWDVEVPTVDGTFGKDRGWVTSSSTLNRCSNPSPPATGWGNFSSEDIWSGNRVSLTGRGGQTMYTNTESKIPAVQDGKTYPWITKDHVRLRCLTTIQNATGEGFVALDTSGTEYHFDWMIVRKASSVKKPYRTTNNSMQRIHAFLAATLVKDRFGNTVEYTYSGDKLTDIIASDGRWIHLAYTGNNVSTVTSSAGTWTYGYQSAQYQQVAATSDYLSSVTRPDGSKWTYAIAGKLYGDYAPTLSPAPDFSVPPDQMNCPSPGEAGGLFTLTATHPSGATGVFEFGYRRHYRTRVPKMCTAYTMGTNSGYYELEVPNYADNFSLNSKTISGTGVATGEWAYDYGYVVPNGFCRQDGTMCMDWAALCPDGSECVTGTKLVSVTSPGGERTRHRFGVQYGINEGRLLGAKVFDGTVVKKETVTTYHTPATLDKVPARIGGRIDWLLFDPLAHLNFPVRATSTILDGATFTSEVTADCHGPGTLCVDEFGSTTSQRKYSSLGYSKTDTTEYSHHLGKWIVGQIKKAYTNGVGTYQVDYDATTALPVRVYQMGKLKQTLTYNADGTVATVSDGRDGVGIETTVTLSNWKRGVPQLIRHPVTPDSAAGATESAVVNDSGTLASVTDEEGNKTCYTYDTMGRLASVTYPSESDTEVGQCNTSSWRATTQTFAASTAAEYGLGVGHWKQTITTGSGTKVVHFDALWRPVVEETADVTNATTATSTRSVTVKRYDTSGRLAFQSYPLSWLNLYTDVGLLGTRTSYDVLDRPVRQEQDSELASDLVTTTNYLSPFKVQVINPRGHSTTTSFMAYEEPSTDWPVAIAHPEGAFTDIARDAFGKPKSLTRRNAGSTVALTRSYVYHPSYQTLCKVIEPETGATIMNYDEADNLAWSASGLNYPDTANCNLNEGYGSGRRAYRTYDARNRILTLAFPDGRGNLAYTYNRDGSTKSLATFNGGVGVDLVTTNYSYHRRGLLKQENMVFGAVDWPIYYAYNANGHLASQTYHGLAIDYSPNALGQPTKAGTFASGVSYYPNGAIKQFTYGNGLNHTMSQNARGLPRVSCDTASVLAPGTCNVGAFINDTYDYDANGNVQAITDGRVIAGVAHSTDRDMEYDQLDRLIGVTSPMYSAVPGSKAVYSYDVLDNLTRVVAPGRDHYYCYNSSWRLTNVMSGPGCTGTTVMGLGYDVQGNLANRSGRDYAFDFGNRLRSVEADTLEQKPDSAYVYDGLGRRVRDYVGGMNGKPAGNKYSQYSKDGQLLQTSDSRSGVFSEYVYVGGSLVAIRERTGPSGSYVYTTKYQHTDALGSPVAVSDANRGLVELTNYEPYGKVLTSPPKDGPGYTGHVLDAATDLNYMQQRYYDPEIGRFLSSDPVDALTGGPQHFNRYSYSYSSPYTYTDPDGRRGKYVGWVVRLGSTTMRYVSRVTFEQAVKIRKMGGNIKGDSHKISRKVENAAHPNSERLRHQGHPLKDDDGNVVGRGLPHYQTEGKTGHSFFSVTGLLVFGAVYFEGQAKAADKVADAADLVDPFRIGDAGPQDECANSCTITTAEFAELRQQQAKERLEEAGRKKKESE